MAETSDARTDLSYSTSYSSLFNLDVNTFESVYSPTTGIANALRQRLQMLDAINEFYNHQGLLVWFSIFTTFIQLIIAVTALSISANEHLEKPLRLYLIMHCIRLMLAEFVSVFLFLQLRQRRANLAGFYRGILSAFVNLRWFLLLFGIVWFILGNLWIYSCQSCSIDAPFIYYFSFTIILLNYVVFCAPIFVCTVLICCLPFTINASNEVSHDKRGCGATDDIINRLPVICFLPDGSDGKLPFGETHCAICLSDYTNEEYIRLLQCDHHFHKNCVDQWLKVNRKCPLCIQSIDPRDCINSHDILEHVNTAR